jgi:hypothetical protein
VTRPRKRNTRKRRKRRNQRKTRKKRRIEIEMILTRRKGRVGGTIVKVKRTMMLTVDQVVETASWIGTTRNAQGQAGEIRGAEAGVGTDIGMNGTEMTAEIETCVERMTAGTEIEMAGDWATETIEITEIVMTETATTETETVTERDVIVIEAEAEARVPTVYWTEPAQVSPPGIIHSLAYNSGRVLRTQMAAVNPLWDLTQNFWLRKSTRTAKKLS